MAIVDNLNELTHEVLGDMQFDFDPIEPGEYVCDRCLTARITIDGAWRGLLTLSVPLRFARRFSADWLSVAEADVSQEMARDGLGELINTLGGHFKARFFGKGQLGLPEVMEDNPVPEPVEGVEEALVAHFKCEGFPIRLSVAVRTS